VSARPVRLLLVEDNDGFRTALELLLDLRPDVEVVAAVSDGNAAVAACREHHPDVVLMDYRMPGMDGVQATAAIHSAMPEIKVIAFTADVSRREVDALFAAGAVECVFKDQELDEIIEAIHRAAA
jgi:two-component system response regulator DesR